MIISDLQLSPQRWMHTLIVLNVLINNLFKLQCSRMWREGVSINCSRVSSCIVDLGATWLESASWQRLEESYIRTNKDHLLFTTQRQTMICQLCNLLNKSKVRYGLVGFDFPSLVSQQGGTLIQWLRPPVDICNWIFKATKTRHAPPLS